MAYSYVRYSGNGSTTNYTFSFPTISTDHIKVRVNGTLVTNWSFLNSSTIQFAAAPASGAVIEIRRETPKDSTIVNFTDGSVLLERDLDLLATWQLYLGQETEDDIEDTIRVDSQSRFDAQNRRIINVADPINAQDAVTKVYADAVIGQATAAASAAAAVQVALAADEAVDSAASALAAASSATASAGYAATSAASAAQAVANATAAASSAGAASSSASNAATSASTATTQASNAATSAAQASAVALGNEPVRHSVRPSLLLDFANTKQLDQRITFSRASTGTYYDGKTVAKAEENLLIYSQELDNSGLWGTVNTSITANSTTAPDGTTTAETITETTSTSIHSLFQSPVGNFLAANTSYTFSAFVKDIDRRYVTLAVSGSNGTFFSATYDLTGVTVTANNASGTGYSHTSSSITSVGSGWYRLVVTGVVGTVVSVQSINISLSTNGTPSLDGRGRESYLGTSKAVYAWGVQIEQRSTVTAYTPTTTAPITNYIPVLQTASAGTPRFDHNPITGESLGLLIEEQRTNLLLQSEGFETATWGKSGATVTANTTVSPDGSTSADSITFSNSADYVLQTYVATYAAGASYSWSVYVRSALRAITWGGATPTGTDAYTSTFVGNGWYRQVLTRTFTTSGTGVTLQPLFAGTQPIGTGTFAVWGAQLEAGAFATSYIPTVASQVTRAADSASITGSNFSSWYRASAGTIYSEFSTTATGVAGVFALNEGAGFQTIDYRAATGFSTVFAAGTTQASLSLGAANSGAATKIATAYAVNDYVGTRNGGAIVSDTSVILPVGVNTLRIGSIDSDTNKINGNIRKIAYYPQRLSNAELQGLTTI